MTDRDEAPDAPAPESSTTPTKTPKPTKWKPGGRGRPPKDIALAREAAASKAKKKGRPGETLTKRKSAPAEKVAPKKGASGVTKTWRSLKHAVRDGGFALCASGVRPSDLGLVIGIGSTITCPTCKRLAGWTPTPPAPGRKALSKALAAGINLEWPFCDFMGDLVELLTDREIEFEAEEYRELGEVLELLKKAHRGWEKFKLHIRDEIGGVR